jgi:fibro-slime domain-containing protein
MYTSELRTGIKFSGSETITIGGGEELWLFINKILVLDIITKKTSNEIPCQKIDLSTAKTGLYLCN